MNTNTFFYELGEYGPILLILLTWGLLWNKKTLFFYYTIGVFFNSILNIILKGIIQQPRPNTDKYKMSILKTYGKNYYFQNGVPFDMFGMPSGHAQSSLFSTAFIYMAFQQKNWFYLYSILSIITCYQRVLYEYHTINQVIIGCIVGFLFSYITYYLYREYQKDKIKTKNDDFAPI